MCINIQLHLSTDFADRLDQYTAFSAHECLSKRKISYFVTINQICKPMHGVFERETTAEACTLFLLAACTLANLNHCSSVQGCLHPWLEWLGDSPYGDDHDQNQDAVHIHDLSM